MSRIATLSLIGSLICFAAYFGNVALGAARQPVILGDIGEMLLLLLSAILFVIGTLAREAIDRERNAETP